MPEASVGLADLARASRQLGMAMTACTKSVGEFASQMHAVVLTDPWPWLALYDPLRYIIYRRSQRGASRTFEMR